MSFISLDFGLFFIVFFFLYWFVFAKSIQQQNTLILIFSYIFYGWWNWNFLALIFISSITDFLIGIFLNKTKNKTYRKTLLYLSFIVNLGILGFFKYFNFFLDNLNSSFTFFGFSPNLGLTLDIILPVGISFYTLQTLSYTLDLYNRKIKASTNFVTFFAYVSFFPQLVAGPIERADNLLPQFNKKRKFSYERSTDGVRQVLWGLFKKMVVADNCATYNEVFNDFQSHNGSTLFLALVFLAFQFYCDFSGYSDIAIGIARILGFDLMKNFNYPFFSRNISEFWQKWHISLISWFRDYVVKNLKGFTKIKLMRNIFIVFILSGFWHGANWTYIFWGTLHALTFLPLIFGKRKRYKTIVAKGKIIPTIRECYSMLKTFLLFSLIGVFFKIDTISNGFDYLSKVFSLSFFQKPLEIDNTILLGITILIVVEWLQRERNHGLEIHTLKIPKVIRWSIYLSLVLIIFLIGSPSAEFIYFQF